MPSEPLHLPAVSVCRQVLLLSEQVAEVSVGTTQPVGQVPPQPVRDSNSPLTINSPGFAQQAAFWYCVDAVSHTMLMLKVFVSDPALLVAVTAKVIPKTLFNSPPAARVPLIMPATGSRLRPAGRGGLAEKLSGGEPEKEGVGAWRATVCEPSRLNPAVAGSCFDGHGSLFTSR